MAAFCAVLFASDEEFMLPCAQILALTLLRAPVPRCMTSGLILEKRKSLPSETRHDAYHRSRAAARRAHRRHLDPDRSAAVELYRCALSDPGRRGWAQCNPSFHSLTATMDDIDARACGRVAFAHVKGQLEMARGHPNM